MTCMQKPWACILICIVLLMSISIVGGTFPLDEASVSMHAFSKVDKSNETISKGNETIVKSNETIGKRNETTTKSNGKQVSSVNSVVNCRKSNYSTLPTKAKTNAVKQVPLLTRDVLNNFMHNSQFAKAMAFMKKAPRCGQARRDCNLTRNLPWSTVWNFFVSQILVLSLIYTGIQQSMCIGMERAFELSQELRLVDGVDSSSTPLIWDLVIDELRTSVVACSVLLWLGTLLLPLGIGFLHFLSEQIQSLFGTVNSNNRTQK